MNLLDENIRQDQGTQLRRWRVPFRRLIEDLAPSGIKDPDIIPLLHARRGVTFFTHDQDFFRRELAHPAYCLAWLDVFDGEAAEFIRRFLRLSAFSTKARRMSVVARIHAGGIQCWRLGGNRPESLPWP